MDVPTAVQTWRSALLGLGLLEGLRSLVSVDLCSALLGLGLLGGLRSLVSCLFRVVSRYSVVNVRGI